ncbi:SPOR domain-containing protein [Pseudodesulfovibrio sediminis]|nr:SPOR domain-containing protein [Pseudodesulfovibrio sediminis]
MRKSISSAPPARRPASQQPAKPAPKPIIDEAPLTGDNEPLDTAAPDADEKPMADVGGDDLGDDLADDTMDSTETPVEEAAPVAKTDAVKEPGIATTPDELPDPAPIIDSTPVAEPAMKDQAKEAVTPPQTTPAQTAPAPVVTTPEAAAPVMVDPENEVVDLEDPVVLDNPVATTAGDYYVQVGAFSDVENATRILEQLRTDGYAGARMVKTETGLYRVQAGAFVNADEADTALETLKGAFPGSRVVKAE